MPGTAYELSLLLEGLCSNVGIVGDVDMPTDSTYSIYAEMDKYYALSMEKN